MILNHIKLGINEVIYFDYEGQPLPLRPITSLEMDDSFYKALGYTPTKIAKFVVELKLSVIKPKEAIELSNEGYAALQKYYNDINYWFVYHGMKDFQDEKFKEPDYTKDERFPKGFYMVQKMNHVHKIAFLLLSHSNAPKEAIKEFVKTPAGNNLGTFIFYLNVPLTDASWKLTNLQRDFLYYSKLGDIKRINRGNISVSGEGMSWDEFKREYL